jgi:hypothetical protein
MQGSGVGKVIFEVGILEGLWSLLHCRTTWHIRANCIIIAVGFRRLVKKFNVGDR